MAEYPDLDGKTVLITGGANGIGAAMVRAFSWQRAQVCFCDLDAPAGAGLAKELGPNVSFKEVDLLKPAEIRRWIDQILKRHESIEVLINNAAADPRIALGAMSLDDWDTLFARNLRSFFLTSQRVVKGMPAGGSIINFSSITFHEAPANMTAYVATKGGIMGFTRSLARELGPFRIRVNTLSPGWIMTDRQLRDYVTASTKKMIRRVQCIPELIQPDEVAEVALFLASDASRAVTGQEILVDRGWAHS